VLEKLQRVGLTPQGRDFLIAALDPFHDTQLRELAGWPDVETAPSVVRCVKQSVTVATNQAPGANWDCHVVQWPWLDALNSRRWGRPLLAPGGGNRIITNPTAAPFNTGGLQIYGVVAGNDLDVTDAGAQVGVIVLNPTISQGSGRIVGMAFEVVNTTAEISKQGQCTVYRQPQSHPTGDTWISTVVPPLLDIPFSAHMIRSPPLNQAQAMLYPGSRQWLAKEGAYIVQTFVGQDNPPQIVRYDQPCIIADPTQEDLCAANNISSVIAPVASQMTPTAVGLNAATKIYPIHTGGAIFTGLSSTSTLTITLNVFYESFPSTAESDILVMATPSAQYDPIALEIFSHCLSQMPVGVTAADNDEGGWFNGLMSIVRDVAPMVAPFLTAVNPMLGAGAIGLGNLAGSYLTAPSPMPPPRVSSTNARNRPAPRPPPRRAIMAPRPSAPQLREQSKQNVKKKKAKKIRAIQYL
jgi:hypothetical protein